MRKLNDGITPPVAGNSNTNLGGEKGEKLVIGVGDKIKFRAQYGISKH